jgi:hypothetical protein
LAAQLGIKFVLYEGGVTTNHPNVGPGSEDLMLMMDPRAGTAETTLYDQYFGLSQASYGFNFTLAGNGSFGAIEDLSDLGTPRYQALVGVAAAP